MNEREGKIERFLRECGHGGAKRIALSGDASSRRYQRIFTGAGGRTLILMDAPPETCEPVDAFVDAAKFLRSIQLSAPAIHGLDRKNGLMLLEDFGDGLIARILEKDSSAEIKIYEIAVDLLADLQSHPPTLNFPAHTPELQGELSALSVSWYRKFAVGAENIEPQSAQIKENIETGIASIQTESVFVHRDYHAENLIWLPEREGQQRVGLLDFQDGSIGHPAYDLVSLLEDARRDVGPGARTRATQKYCEATGKSMDAVNMHLAICGAQRNLRIIGVFARLAIRDRKPWYLDLLPRVWRNLEFDLSHPCNSKLESLVRRIFPAPDPQILDKLRIAASRIPAGP